MLAVDIVTLITSTLSPSTAAAPAPVFKEEVEVEEVQEPVKRASKKAEVPPAAPKAALADVISAWSDN